MNKAIVKNIPPNLIRLKSKKTRANSKLNTGAFKVKRGQVFFEGGGGCILK